MVNYLMLQYPALQSILTEIDDKDIISTYSKFIPKHFGMHSELPSSRQEPQNIHVPVSERGFTSKQHKKVFINEKRAEIGLVN